MSFTYRDRRRITAGERRDPKVATASTTFVSPHWHQTPDWNAERAVRRAYLEQLYVYRCVRAIANDIAALPFRVGADPSKPNDYDPKAPLAKLLAPLPSKPNPVMTARTLWAHTIAMYLITGRAAWENDFGSRGAPGTGNPLVAVWPLPAHLVNVKEAEDGAPGYFAGYHVEKRGQQIDMTLDEITYMWRPSLLDPHQAESVLQAPAINIDVASMLDRYSWSFLRNSATPATLVVTAEFAEAQAREDFRAQFNADHTGVRNAGRTVFSEAIDGNSEGGVAGMVDIKQLGLSQKDSQFSDQMKQRISDICVAFGVPLSKLGDASGRTFDNAGQEDENYWLGTNFPLMAEILDQVNLNLAPRFGDNVGWFDTSGVEVLKPKRNIIPVTVTDLKDEDLATVDELRDFMGLPAENEDLTKQIAAKAAGNNVRSQYANVGLPALIEAGVLTPDDARKLLGLEGTAPGKPEPDPAPTPPQLAPFTGQQDPQPAPDTQPEPPVPPKEPPPARQRNIDALTAGIRVQLNQLLDRQADAVHRWLSGKRGVQLLSRGETDELKVYDPDHWRGETRRWAAGVYEMTAAMLGAKEIPVSVRSMFEVRANSLAREIVTGVETVVRAAYRDAVRMPESDHLERVAIIDMALADHVSAVAEITAEREATAAYDAIGKALGNAVLADLLSQLSTGELDLDAAAAAIEGED